MAPKAAHERAKKKAAKQKKILLVLALPMLGALVYAYMTLTSLGAKPQPVSATPAAATAPAGSIPTAGTPDTTITPGVAAVPISSLRSFTALGRKDPFHTHGPRAGAGSDSSGSSGSSGSGSKGSGSGSSKGSGSGSGSKVKQPSVPLTGAVISINGEKLALALGGQFGHAPGLSGVALFRLVKATSKTAVIAVVGTRQRFTLRVRRPLTLQQDGGWTYTLLLEPVGSAAPMTVQPTQTTNTTINDQQTP
jgi:hypothetical protein